MLKTDVTKAGFRLGRSSLKGFTLIEVMVVVAIVAVLASIAVPSYREYVRAGQLTDAGTWLSDARVKMEQYFQDNRKYPTACVTAAPGATQLLLPATEYFTYTCPTLTATTFTVQASGSAGLTTGFSYTIDHNNVRATTASVWGADHTSLTRWIMKK